MILTTTLLLTSLAMYILLSLLFVSCIYVQVLYIYGLEMRPHCPPWLLTKACLSTTPRNQHIHVSIYFCPCYFVSCTCTHTHRLECSPFTLPPFDSLPRMCSLLFPLTPFVEEMRLACGPHFQVVHDRPETSQLLEDEQQDIYKRLSSIFFFLFSWPIRYGIYLIFHSHEPGSRTPR